MMETEAILERIKHLKTLKSDKEIALLLGLSPQDFSNRKRRKTLRPLVLDWAAREGINVNWLVCEEEELYARQEGEESFGGDINKDLLRLVIEMAEQGGEELGIHPKADKKAELIVTLYELHQNQKEIDRKTLFRLIRLAG